MFGQTVIKQDGELLGLERLQRGVCLSWPPAQTALRQPADDQVEAEAVVAEQFQSCSAAIAKDEESAGERIFVEMVFAQRCQAIDTFAKVNGLACEQDAKLWDELDH